MRLTDNLMGAALMTVCVLAYVVNDAVMKLLFADMALIQAVFLRGLITIPLLCVIGWRSKAAIRGLSHQNKWLVALRVGAETGATIAFLTALKHMPLANVSAILLALPLAVTMAAALFLGEPVGWRRWSAIPRVFTSGEGFIPPVPASRGEFPRRASRRTSRGDREHSPRTTPAYLIRYAVDFDKSFPWAL